MNNKEIVKALEHCADVNSICEDCVLFNPKDDDCKCSRVLKRNALDLINHLQVENEKNENIIRLADKTIETQNAEIEQLKANSDSRQINECENINIAHIKAEAYKEFAELIIREYPETDYFVNNLLKELVGEDK